METKTERTHPGIYQPGGRGIVCVQIQPTLVQSQASEHCLEGPMSTELGMAALLGVAKKQQRNNLHCLPSAPTVQARYFLPVF